MPHFRIETNVEAANVPKNFAERTCEVLAKMLGKPMNYCVATVIPGVNMSMGGTKEPCAQATLMSIGALGKDKNKQYSKILSEHVNSELGIGADRMYIQFVDAAPTYLGFNGSTFGHIFGES